MKCYNDSVRTKRVTKYQTDAGFLSKRPLFGYIVDESRREEASVMLVFGCRGIIRGIQNKAQVKIIYDVILITNKPF